MSLLAHVLLCAWAIGFVGGLRSLAAPAVVCWAAYLHVLDLSATPLAFLGTRAAAGIFTLLALAELVTDKLPKTPARTGALGLGARITLGALCGAAFAFSTAQVGWLVGAAAGAVGGVAGAFTGYQARTQLVRALHVPDFAIALAEDAVAIAAAILIVTHV